MRQGFRNDRTRAAARLSRPGGLALVLLGLLSLAGPGAAEPEPAFMRQLFPPELVMRNQHEIGLTPEQRKVITEAIRDTQGRVLEVQWALQDEVRKLTELLAGDRIDEEKTLEQVDRVLGLEEQIKKAHMGLLIRIRNQLTAGQRSRLDALRPDELAALLDLY